MKITRCKRLKRGLFYIFLFVVLPSANAEVINDLNETERRLHVTNIVISARGNIELGKNALKRLTRLAINERKKYPEKVSIDELHQIADILTVNVRKRGHTFDTVYLPPQKVSNGLIRFAYETAVLADINVINKTRRKNAIFARAFQHLLNQPLYAPDVENLVFALQKLQGVDAFAFYSRGKTTDKIVLNIKVEERNINHFGLRIENYGSEATGTNRLVGEAKAYSLMRSFDQLSLAVMATEGEGSSNYGYIHYRWPFSNLNTSINIGFGDSQFALGDGETTIEMNGDSQNYRMSLDHVLSHVPTAAGNFSLAYFAKDSELTSEFGEALRRDENSSGVAIDLSRQWSSVQRTWRIGMGGSLIWGEFQTSDIEDSKSQELKKAEYHVLLSRTIAPQYRLGFEFRSFLRGQYSEEEFLPGIESLALGGAYGVRAAESGKYSADRGYVLSTEIHWPFLLKNPKHIYFSPYVFGDMAEAESFDLSGNKVTSELSGYGIGFNIGWKRLSANIVYAEPSTLRISDSATSNEVESDAQVLFQLRWQ